MVCGTMEVVVPTARWDSLYDTRPEKVEVAVTCLKNSIIGNLKQKELIIEQGLLARLISLLVDHDVHPRIKTSVVHIISSISKGSDTTRRSLLDSGVVKILLNGLNFSDLKLTEACLQSLVSIFNMKNPPVEVIYSDPIVVSQILSLMPQSTNCGIAACRLLSAGTMSTEQQNILVSGGAPNILCSLLSSPVTEAQLSALHCLAKIVYQNENAAQKYLITSDHGKQLLSLVVQYTRREYIEEIQLESSRILTYMYRSKVLEKEDVVVYRVLPCLVRLCKKEEKVENRIVAAETLAYLIQVNVELQQIAAISNHLIPTVASFLKWAPEPKQRSGGMTKLQLTQLNQKIEEDANNLKNLRKAAFNLFGSLSADDEDIRKRLIDTEPLVDTVVGALQDNDEDWKEVKMAAIRCLHSLSRSVQLLRTTFQDHTVWEPLMKILASPTDKVESVLVASSTLCNLLLDFSPSKEKLLDSGAVELLCELTHQQDPSLRLNGVWGLMNLSFNSEQRIKSHIMTTLGTDQVFRLLSDPGIQVVMKTLGLLRNLLSNDKQHIDHISSLYGKQLMHAVVFILESENSPEVKEQALCLLANIADGDTSKKLIVDNEDMLKKLKSYMLHNNTNLQTAAVVCIQNLVWREEDGSCERQAKLKDIGVFNILKQLLATEDTDLFEKVKTALQQASM